MILTIDRRIYDAVLLAARKAAPLEACGLLGGKDGRVTEFYELTNMDSSSEHFSLKPEEQFTAIRDMRSKGLRMLAIWHSHPASPARMSPEDLRLAYTPDVAYLILSLADTNKPDLRGFVVNDNNPDEIVVTIEE